MTTSTHTYTATLLTDPETELHLDADNPGSIRLDSGRAPHVTGTLRLTPQSLDVLAALDPRETPRIRIDVAATFPTGAQTRTFDLGVRDFDRDQEDVLPELPVASDEALLIDYAPLSDDATPRTHEASLRAVCNYVLGEAIPGASLEAGPTDADVTAYWSVTNLFTNPSFENTVAGWANGSLATGLAPTTGQAWVGSYSGHWQTTGAGQSFIDFNGPISVQAGRSYVFSAYMRATVARPARLMIRFKNAAGVLLSDRYSAPVNLTTTGWTRIVNIQTAPAGATQVSAHVEYQASAAGQFPYVDGLMFYEGTEAIPYFDGATPDSSTYTYDWTGAANVSTATRTPLVERPPESLIWRAGVDALAFLSPLLQAAGLRLVCDEQRRWTLRDESYRAPGALTVRYGINMIAGRERISRDSGLWFDARVTRYTWTDADGTRQERIDAFALNTPHTRLTTLEIEAPYPGPGRSEYAVRRAQGRGREVTVTKVSDWFAAAEQPISINLDGAPTQLGITQSIEFDLSNDRMTIETRTTDTPADAVDLLAGTVDALVGTVDDL